MEHIKVTSQHYYPESDEMEWVINVDTPQPAISYRVDDFFYIRINPETNQVVGATLFNASEWFGELARAFASKSLDNPEVNLYIQRKLESLLQRA